MDDFRTEINPEKSDWEIGHTDRVLLLGSCFSDNIGRKLLDSKFHALCNPFGTLFSPHVILNLVKRAVNNELFEQSEFFKHDDLWHHWELNNVCSSADLTSALPELNAKLIELKEWIANTDYICVTLGTAWVYKLIETDAIVANCHKVNGSLFTKYCLSYNKVSAILAEFIELVKSVNKNVKFLFTVSPVRHWKDGPVQNSKSKAILRLAIDEVLTEDVKYFPAYELMMDDLRDYRFYEDDMLHPSKIAIDYIYTHFSKVFFNQETLELNVRVKRLTQSLNHRPIHAESSSQEVFQRELDKKKTQFLNDFPYLKDRF